MFKLGTDSMNRPRILIRRRPAEARRDYTPSRHYSDYSLVKEHKRSETTGLPPKVPGFFLDFHPATSQRRVADSSDSVFAVNLFGEDFHIFNRSAGEPARPA